MTNQSRMRFLMFVSTQLFQIKQSYGANAPDYWQGVRCPVNQDFSPFITYFNPRMFKNSETGQHTLFGVDATLNLGNKELRLRMIEQNPDKRYPNGNLKKFANLARQGSQIVWVINQDGGFLGRVQDGKWHFSKERAYTEVAPTPTTMPEPTSYDPPPAFGGDSETVVEPMVEFSAEELALAYEEEAPEWLEGLDI